MSDKNKDEEINHIKLKYRIIIVISSIMWLLSAILLMTKYYHIYSILLFLAGLLLPTICYNYSNKKEQSLAKGILANGLQVFTIIITILWAIFCALMSANTLFGGFLPLIFLFSLPVIIILNVVAIKLRKKVSEKNNPYQKDSKKPPEEYTDDSI